MKNTTETRIRQAGGRVATKIFLAIIASTIFLELLTFTPLYRIVIIYETHLMTWIYSILKISYVVQGENVITLYRIGKHVITLVLLPSCTGVYAITTFLILISLTPAPQGTNRIRALALGMAILFTANILRIAIAGIVGIELGYNAFMIFHEIFGGAAMLLISATLWLDWLYGIHVRGGWP